MFQNSRKGRSLGVERARILRNFAIFVEAFAAIKSRERILLRWIRVCAIAPPGKYLARMSSGVLFLFVACQTMNQRSWLKIMNRNHFLGRKSDQSRCISEALLTKFYTRKFERYVENVYMSWISFRKLGVTEALFGNCCRSGTWRRRFWKHTQRKVAVVEAIFVDNLKDTSKISKMRK